MRALVLLNISYNETITYLNTVSLRIYQTVAHSDWLGLLVKFWPLSVQYDYITVESYHIYTFIYFTNSLVFKHGVLTLLSSHIPHRLVKLYGARPL